MTATNGWPDKPGVPLHPEKDGDHWLKSALTGEMYLFKWKAEKFYSCGQPQILPHWVNHPMWQVQEMIYLGPCLTPDEVQNLRDDLASAERERAHQHGRADRNAAEYAREQARREALQARAVKWAGIVGTLMAERDQLIGVLQIAIERSGDSEPRPAWVDGACGLLNKGFLKVDRAALAEASALQKRVAELEGALNQAKQHFVADEPLKAFVEICAALTGGKDE